MTQPTNLPHRGLLADAAGVGLVAAGHEAAPASAQLHTQRKTIDTNLGASVEQPSARAASIDIRRTA